MEATDMKDEVQRKELQTYKWLIGVLTSIVSFFLVMTYTKVDTIDKNLQVLITNDAVQAQKIDKNTEDINGLKSDVRNMQRDVYELQKTKR